MNEHTDGSNGTQARALGRRGDSVTDIAKVEASGVVKHHSMYGTAPQ